MRKPRLFRRLSGERSGFMRPLLLGLVFAAAGMLYWQHMGNRIADLGDTDLHDAHNVFTQDQRRLLRRQRALLKQETGVRLLLRVDTGNLHVPVYDSGVLFMGAGLRHKEAVVVFPPHMQRALGEGARLKLEDDLRQCLRSDKPLLHCFEQGIDGVRTALRDTG